MAEDKWLEIDAKYKTLSAEDLERFADYIKSGGSYNEDVFDQAISEFSYSSFVSMFQRSDNAFATNWNDDFGLTPEQDQELMMLLTTWAYDAGMEIPGTGTTTGNRTDNNPSNTTSNTAVTEETNDSGFKFGQSLGFGTGNSYDTAGRGTDITHQGGDELITPLMDELARLEGIVKQDPETGANIDNNSTMINQYTTRLFGAPFQLLDSVDRRFPSINKHVGNEYLRNFLLNSPILSIRPGMPQYTGDKDPNSIKEGIKNIYLRTENNGNFMGNVMDQMLQVGILGKGSKLQRRMFGFRETYYQYMQYVNYMCRSTAVFLGLTSDTRQGDFPNGTFLNSNSGDGWMPFEKAKWENYRMMDNSIVMNPLDYLASLFGITTDGNTTRYEEILSTLNMDGSADNYNSWRVLRELDLGITESSFDDGTNFFSTLFSVGEDEISAKISQAISDGKNNSWSDKMVNKVSCVQFMVEPGDYTETLTNVTANSIVENTTDAVNDIGAELAFITNSAADTEFLGGIISFLGDTTSSALMSVSKLVSDATNSGFIHNLFSGALRSLKGQKMIYPQIYKSSNSTMNHEFTITLTTPYGDIYNYYMNIVVPLLHLVALAAPRMVTANSVSSPFLVQSYIPGMCTCQLGIIQQMTIQKNPTGKHVSVNGFPLTVKVHFVIQELYNAMSISPANDPASFLFNETLNDYLANLSGLIPSIDTYTAQRDNAFANMYEYMGNGEWLNDMVSPILEAVENASSPFR